MNGLNLLDFADSMGIVAFALSGFFVATKHHLDLLGVAIASFLTALGGGIIRDVVVGVTPVSFMHYFPITLVLFVLVFALLFKLHRIPSIESKPYFIFFDTLGLSSFAITGALVGIEHQFNLFGVMSLALMTAVGGGVMRDIMLNKIPFFLKSEFYGIVALFLGGTVYVADIFSLADNIYMLMGIFSVGVLIRLMAYYKQWHLPQIKGN